MSDSEKELGEEVLVQFSLTMTIVSPLLTDLIIHFTVSVETCENFVNTRKQFSVLLLGDKVA